MDLSSEMGGAVLLSPQGRIQELKKSDCESLKRRETTGLDWAFGLPAAAKLHSLQMFAKSSLMSHFAVWQISIRSLLGLRKERNAS